MRMVLIQFLSAVPQAIPPVILDVGIKKSRSKVIQMNGLENTEHTVHHTPSLLLPILTSLFGGGNDLDSVSRLPTSEAAAPGREKLV
ncbi:hypothetical protein B0H16DRAFT_1640252, partial [Mycena metata]